MTEDNIELNTETLSGDLRTAVMDRIRALDLTWGMMPATHQRALSQEIDGVCRHLVKETVKLIVADGHPVISAVAIDAKKNKNGAIEGKFIMSGEDEMRHELIDATPGKIVIIVADDEKYLGEREPEPIDPDQPDLIDSAAA